jgi:hypothetical protein
VSNLWSCGLFIGRGSVMEVAAPYPVIILLTCVGERLRPVVGPREMGRKYSSSLSDFTTLPQSGSLGLAPLHTAAHCCLPSECGPRSFAYRSHFLYMRMYLRPLSHGRLSRRRLVAQRQATGVLCPDTYEKSLALTSDIVFV